MTDWPVKTLGEFFDSKPKNSESLKQKDYLSSGKFPVVDQGQELIGGFTNDQHLVRDFETPVIVFGDHTRCVKYIDFPFASGADGTKILVPRKGVDPRYAYFQLLSIELPTKGYARHFGELSKYSFVLPPLEEQKRIVALLDAATARVTELNACYEQARTHANNLFTSALRDALESNPDWPVKTLGEVCEIYQPQTIGLKDMVSDGRYVVYGANGPIGHYDRFNHENSEVTVTCRGATCGTVNVTPPQVWITGNAMVVRPNEAELSKLLLKYWLECLDYSSVITGAAQPQITRTTLSPMMIPVPPLEEQKKIVERLDSMRAKTSEMVVAYDAKLSAAKNLRQSILESAFAGDL